MPKKELLFEALLWSLFQRLDRLEAQMAIATKQITALGISSPNKANKQMTCAVTAADGDLATATVMAAAPIGNALVFVNGVEYVPGDGTKVNVSCFFSGDGGTTARASGAVAVGDTIRWNGSVALFQLAVTDKMDVLFNS